MNIFRENMYVDNIGRYFGMIISLRGWFKSISITLKRTK